MAKFCTKCGRPLLEGQMCSCQQTATPNFSQSTGFNGGFGGNYNPNPNPNPNPVPPTDSATGFGQNQNFGNNQGFGQNQNFNGGFNPGPNPNPPARRCPNCGRELVAGRACVCTQQRANAQAVSVNVDSLKDIWVNVKNHMGIGDPETNATDAYEKDKKIVPDIIKPNDKEVPVKQFQVAKLRNRLFGIPYMKAIGRIQVTNKRVIFRAPGKCVAGKTAISHEFAIDEIAGIESRREFVFNIWDLMFGVLFALVAGALLTWFDGVILKESKSYLLTAFVAFFLGLAGCVPFALLHKKWWLKVMCLGGTTMSLFTVAGFAEYFNYEWLGVLLSLFGWVTLVLGLISLFFHTIKPNLVLMIKTKAATQAIDISRKKENIVAALLKGGAQNEEHTGYAEVLPEADAEKSIREIGAIINDIQKLGDFGIEKWKED